MAQSVREYWMKDPEFAELDQVQQDEILMNYFNKQMVDDDFRALPQEEQDNYINKFKEMEGIGPQPLSGEDLSGIPTTRGGTQWDTKTQKPKIGSGEEGPSLGDNLTERATNTWDYMKRQFSDDDRSLLEEDGTLAPYDPDQSGIWGDIAKSAIVALGQTVGAGEDIASAGLGALYRYATPDEMQANLYDKFLNISTTKWGKAGLSALGKGLEKYQAWADENPDKAIELGSVLNILGGSLVKDVIKGSAKMSAEQALRAGALSVEHIGEITAKEAKRRIDGFVNKYFIKAIRPALSLGKTDDAIKKFKRSAGDAVYDIVENKRNLKLTDSADNIVDYNLPRTRKQFNEAIGQRKKEIFQEFDEIAKIAGEQGISIDMRPLYEDTVDELGNVIKEAPLNSIANSVGLAATDPKTVERATELIDLFKNRLKNGQMSAMEAQRMITAAANMKGKVPGLDSILADYAREQLNGKIDKLVNPRYSNLKRMYGYYKDIEESVSKSALSGERSTKGITERLTNIWTLGRVAKGFITGDAPEILRGMTEKAAETTMRRLTEPDKMIEKMFSKADDAFKKAPKPDLGEVADMYKNVINESIQNDIKLLESGMIPKQLEQGAIRIRETGPLRTSNPGVAKVTPEGEVTIEPKYAPEYDTDAWRKTRAHKAGEKGGPPEDYPIKPRPAGANPEPPAPQPKAKAKPKAKASGFEENVHQKGRPSTWRPKKIEEIDDLMSQGQKGDEYYWRDDIYGGNFTTNSKNPKKVYKALMDKRREFKKAGNKPITKKPQTTNRPMNEKEQEDWMAALRAEVDKLKKKK